MVTVQLTEDQVQLLGFLINRRITDAGWETRNPVRDGWYSKRRAELITAELKELQGVKAVIGAV